MIRYFRKAIHFQVLSRWREIGERRKIEAKMFEKAQFTWGK